MTLAGSVTTALALEMANRGCSDSRRGREHLDYRRFSNGTGDDTLGSGDVDIGDCSDLLTELLRRVATLSSAFERLLATRAVAIDEALDAGCLIAHVARHANVGRHYLYSNHNAAQHAKRNAERAAQVRARRLLAAKNHEAERDAQQKASERRLWLEGCLDAEPQHLGAESSPTAGAGRPEVSATGSETYTDRRDPYRDPARNPTLGLDLEPGCGDPAQLAVAVAASLVLRNDRVEGLIARFSDPKYEHWSQWEIDREVLEQLEWDREEAEFEYLFHLVPIPEKEWTPSEQAAVHAAVQAAEHCDPGAIRRLQSDVRERWRGKVAARERCLQCPPDPQIEAVSKLTHPLLDPERDPLRRLPPEPWDACHNPTLESVFEAARALLPKRVKFLATRQIRSTFGPAKRWDIYGLVLCDLLKDRVRAEEDRWSGLSPIPEHDWTPSERAAVQEAERRNAAYVPHMSAPGYAEWRGRIVAKTRFLSNLRSEARLEPGASSLQERDAGRSLNLSLPPKPWGVDHADQLAEAVAQARSAFPAFVRAVQRRYANAEYSGWPEWKRHEAMLNAVERAYPD